MSVILHVHHVRGELHIQSNEHSMQRLQQFIRGSDIL